MKCSVQNCRSEAARWSRRLDAAVCSRCYEETDLASPHVPLSVRVRALLSAVGRAISEERDGWRLGGKRL